jgi:hypothetical protein
VHPAAAGARHGSPGTLEDARGHRLLRRRAPRGRRDEERRRRRRRLLQPAQPQRLRGGLAQASVGEVRVQRRRDRKDRLGVGEGVVRTLVRLAGEVGVDGLQRHALQRQLAGLPRRPRRHDGVGTPDAQGGVEAQARRLQLGLQQDVVEDPGVVPDQHQPPPVAGPVVVVPPAQRRRPLQEGAEVDPDVRKRPLAGQPGRLDAVDLHGPGRQPRSGGAHERLELPGKTHGPQLHDLVAAGVGARGLDVPRHEAAARVAVEPWRRRRGGHGVPASRAEGRPKHDPLRDHSHLSVPSH